MLALRAADGTDLEWRHISPSRFAEWNTRVVSRNLFLCQLNRSLTAGASDQSARGTLMIPEKSRLVVECSGKYGATDFCQDCVVLVVDAWRDVVLAAGRAGNPLEPFTCTLTSYWASSRRFLSVSHARVLRRPAETQYEPTAEAAASPTAMTLLITCSPVWSAVLTPPCNAMPFITNDIERS